MRKLSSYGVKEITQGHSFSVREVRLEARQFSFRDCT